MNVDWELALLAPADEPSDGSALVDIEAERAASLAYAAENGYDVDIVSGRYLPPECEVCHGAGTVGFNPTSHPAWETDAPCPECAS